MRILFVTGEYPPDRGGVADYTSLLGSALVAEGVEVAVLTRRKHRWTVAAHSDDPVRVYRSVPRWDMWTPYRVRRATALVRSDVVHFQHQEAAFDMSFAAHLAPAWVARRTRVCVAVTYHDLKVPYLFPKAGRIRRWASLLPARSADVVIATTGADGGELARAGVPAAVVPIGSNIGPPPPDFDAAEWRSRYAPDADPLLVYFGLLNASKGLAALAELLGRFAAAGRPPRLVMVGSGTGSSDPTNETAAGHLKGLLEVQGVEGLVSYTGHLPPDQVASWLAAADVVVLPYDDGASYRRGSLLAALTCGAAIVTTTPQSGATGSPLPEFLDEHPALLVPPGDGEALYRAVERLAGDQEGAQRLRREAADLATAFAWPAIARRHAALYDACAARIP